MANEPSVYLNGISVSRVKKHSIFTKRLSLICMYHSKKTLQLSNLIVLKLTLSLEYLIPLTAQSCSWSCLKESLKVI